MDTKTVSPRNILIDLISSLPDEAITEIIHTIAVKAIEKSFGVSTKVEDQFLDYVYGHMEQMLLKGQLGKELDEYIMSMKPICLHGAQ